MLWGHDFNAFNISTTVSMSKKPLIVLADNNQADRMLIKVAMEDMRLDAQILEMPDGETMIEFAKTQCRNRVPKFIVLDMDMPKLDGVELLNYLSENPDLCKVPVVVFTSTDGEHYRQKAKDAGVVKYFIKGSSLKEYKEVVKFLKNKLDGDGKR
jgi:CheY-like chemotaxis protein